MAAKLENLTKGAAVKGVLPDQTVTVVDLQWHGSAVVERMPGVPPAGSAGLTVHWI